LKAGLAAALALLLTPVVGDGLSDGHSDALAVTAGLAGELAIGAVLGTAVRFVFSGITMAGELAAVERPLLERLRKLRVVEVETIDALGAPTAFRLFTLCHVEPSTNCAGLKGEGKKRGSANLCLVEPEDEKKNRRCPPRAPPVFPPLPGRGLASPSPSL
jgi:hypothetical protein